MRGIGISKYFIHGLHPIFVAAFLQKGACDGHSHRVSEYRIISTIEAAISG